MNMVLKVRARRDRAAGTAGLGRLPGGGAAAAAGVLRRALGALWLADALVKAAVPFGDRPASQWYGQVMTAMTAAPGLHRLLAWEARVFLAHPLLWWLPAGIELAIGGWLIARPASRPAVAASAAWAVVVWVAGEGMAGLFGGSSSVLAGYPGAALVYAAAAMVLFPRRPPAREGAGAAAEAGLPGLYWSRVAWLVLWLGAAFVTALPQNGPGAPDSMLFLQQQESGGVVRAMDSAVLGWLSVANEQALGFAVAAGCLAVAFAVFLGALPRVALSLSIVIAIAGWVVFQNFGGILTGSSTDVGTGPVLLLLAAAFWPLAPARQARRPEAGTAAPPPARQGGGERAAVGEPPA